MKNKRRLKAVKLTGEFLTDLFREGNEINVEVVDGLPEDTEFRRMEYIDTYDHYWLIVWSSTFEPVDEASRIPKIDVEFKEKED